jgi:PAS domain S-box-containing protein
MTAAETALEGEPEFLRLVLDASRLLVLVVDRAGMIQHANRALCRTADLSSASSNIPIWQLTAVPVERDLLEAGFSPFKPEAFPSGVLFHVQSSQTSRLVDWDVRLLAERPDAELVVMTGVDVTDRIAGQQRLRETEAFQRRVLDRLPAIVWTTDREMRTTFSAGGGLATLGLASGEVALMGTPVSSYFQTDDPKHPGIDSHLRALRGESCVLEMDWFGRHYHARVEPLRDTDDDIVGAIGLAFDMTEQARTAHALKESEAQLRRLVTANVIGIFFFEENGRVTQSNEAFLELVGYSRAEMEAGKVSWRAMTPREFRELDDMAIAELKSTGRCTSYEKAYVRKDGTRVPVLVGGAAFQNGAEGHGRGRPNNELGGVAFIVDLREQVRLRQARDRLLRRERRARAESELANTRLLLLVEGSKRLSRTMTPHETLETLAAVVVPDLADWTYVVHRGWTGGDPIVASATGDPKRRRLLRALQECVPDPDALQGAARVFRTGEPELYENITDAQLMPDAPGGPVVATRDPAHLRTVRELGMKSLLCVPIEGRGSVDGVMMLVASGDPRRYAPEDVVLARDLAARAAVSLENGRLLAEALDAVRVRDDFLAVAAHELRTPLTSLLLHVQMLSRAIERSRPDNAGVAAHSIAAAQGQARRLSVLVDGLLDVSRLASNRLALRVEETSLDELVDGVLSTMAPDFRRANCPITVSVPSGVTVRWDRIRIEQVLTNLLSNAMKFGAGSPIDVRVEAPDDDVEIAVRDFGIGISKEDQARIFGRFERAVSTRNFGGLGLGLYISSQIVRSHQGSLRVESEPGKGARFIVRLPRGTQPSQAVEGVQLH